MARRFVRDALRDAGVDVDTAILLVSEVVTNAVLHARSPLRVRVTTGDGFARVAVTDGSPVPPRLHTFSHMSATGRGLRMVEQLSRAWGVETSNDGKTVWFEVATPSESDWDSFTSDELFAEGGVSDL